MVFQELEELETRRTEWRGGGLIWMNQMEGEGGVEKTCLVSDVLPYLHFCCSLSVLCLSLCPSLPPFLSPLCSLHALPPPLLHPLKPLRQHGLGNTHPLKPLKGWR